jgi:hypothetical protein
MTRDQLLKFCAPDDVRHYLCDLINVESWTYACNGHMVVRVPRLAGEPDSRACIKVVATIEEILSFKYTQWIPVPECKFPPKMDCVICHATGIHECSCGHEHECHDCNGTGKTEASITAVKVGDSFFSDKYLSLIQGWEISVAGGMEKAGIRYNDAVGILMPMRE